MTQMDKLIDTLKRINDASDEDKETVARVMGDIVTLVLSDSGAAVFFIDPDGAGEMHVHMLGDMDIAPQMLRAAPALYREYFSAPEGSALQ